MVSWRGLFGVLAAIALVVEPMRTQQLPEAVGRGIPKKAVRQNERSRLEFPSTAWAGVRRGVASQGERPFHESAARKITAARRSHGVDSTSVGIGVLSTGVATLVNGEASEICWTG